MTRVKATKKDNPATDPKRENSQGKHDGVPHDPQEFEVMNPARQEKPEKNDR
ncbi:hypothetical protein [Paracoccus laeviglucosivorans]|uniref:Uncharacterized protein n=1 Tax=Paracoccus laeviglucosivorans TaxID=1197861 RepID=A0A521ENU2_9RHOB|nr:hypothetical protein [Paracoccus laeviglucosivorans]SMO85575.1 hypothetical protein SAMN06265221_11462 [Paracoccus laeviglucosivorans]